MARKVSKKKKRAIAKKYLKPGFIKHVGEVGFTQCVEELKGKKGIRNPEKLCGWGKKMAAKKGLLKKEHAYGKKRKKK